MASFSVARDASLFSTRQKTRMSKHTIFSSSFTMPPSSFFPNFSSLNSSSNYKIRTACMSKTTFQVGKDDEKRFITQPTENKVIEVSSWIDYLPKEIQPFAKLARVDKPIGTWLLLFPFAWSAALAAPSGSLPDLKTLAIFSCAAPLLRGAACTINDFLDRDLDKMVERTKLRPIASGAVTPFQGLCFFAFQIVLSHGILLQLANNSTIYEASFIFLIYTYPLMKRITYWAQAYLSLTFNWGAFFGWYAVKRSLKLSVVFPLLLGSCFWTILYDTIYAHQDKKDDIKAGIKSTALKFANSTKEWLTAFSIACILSFALAGYNAGIGWPFYVGLAAASGQLAWQIWTADLSSPEDCNRKFVSNKFFGAIVFSGILVGKVFS